jgi:hypothetical protein
VADAERIAPDVNVAFIPEFREERVCVRAKASPAVLRPGEKRGDSDDFDLLGGPFSTSGPFAGTFDASEITISGDGGRTRRNTPSSASSVRTVDPRLAARAKRNRRKRGIGARIPAGV